MKNYKDACIGTDDDYIQVSNALNYESIKADQPQFQSDYTCLNIGVRDRDNNSPLKRYGSVCRDEKMSSSDETVL